MLTLKSWKVLIVDDQEDVHQVTELALKRSIIYGLPLEMYHARSAKEAEELLSGWSFADRRLLVAAIIDVVMETDNAGLELCRFIREDLSMPIVQLVVRTGQPGMAPARQVVDQYDISFYATKAESDADRLYALVKQSVKGYYAVASASLVAWTLDSLQAICADRKDVVQKATQFMNDPRAGGTLNVGIEVGAHYLGAGTLKERTAFEQLKKETLPQAEKGLKNLTWANGIPSPFAVVGNVAMCQVKSLRDGRVATLLVQNASVPTGQEHIYGPMWRTLLRYYGELLADL